MQTSLRMRTLYQRWMPEVNSLYGFLLFDYAHELSSMRGAASSAFKSSRMQPVEARGREEEYQRSR